MKNKDFFLSPLSSTFHGRDVFRLGRQTPVVMLNGTVIKGIARAYSDVRAGEMVALLGSSGRLEVACSQGNAAARLCARRGTAVEVSS